jgi:hypothetical protein
MRHRPGLRGTRLATPSNQVDRGAAPIARRRSTYWCVADHRTPVDFAADVEPPVEWTCHTCSAPATLERGAAPTPAVPRHFPHTPHEFLMMRRSVEDGERILAEALSAMRHHRPPYGDGTAER